MCCIPINILGKEQVLHDLRKHKLMISGLADQKGKLQQMDGDEYANVDNNQTGNSIARLKLVPDILND